MSRVIPQVITALQTLEALEARMDASPDDKPAGLDGSELDDFVEDTLAKLPPALDFLRAEYEAVLRAPDETERRLAGQDLLAAVGRELVERAWRARDAAASATLVDEAAHASATPTDQEEGTTMLKLVQAGHGARRALVIGYFLDVPVWESLKEAIGPDACILSDCDDSGGRFAHGPGHGGGVDSIDAALAFARTHFAAFGDPTAIVLIGWSAGCQAVREQLRVDTAYRIGAAVALDGISGSHPPVTPQMSPWTTLAEQAAHGDLLLVVSHTQMTYVERLPVGQAYASTVTTAKLLCDHVGIAAPGPGEEAALGNFHVVSSPSADMDAPAHIRQVHEVMPDVVKRFVAPWLAKVAPPEAPPAEDQPASGPTEPPDPAPAPEAA